MPGDTTESRERILRSAATCFAAYGFQHSTFEEIAAGAGVSRTLLYRHFASKVDLLRAVGIVPSRRGPSRWTKRSSSSARPAGPARGRSSARPSDSRAPTRSSGRSSPATPDSRCTVTTPRAASSRQTWRDRPRRSWPGGQGAESSPPDLDVRASADVLCAMQLGVIEQMHHVGDPRCARPRHISSGVPHPASAALPRRTSVPVASGAVA